MDKNTIKKLIQLRYLVGFLGEKAQYNWWSSNFMNDSSKKMLEFTFPRTGSLAQYSALSVAAARVHDNSIGIGKSFHLFRLPEFFEKSLIVFLQSNQANELEQAIISKEMALNSLSEMAGSASVNGEGPLNVGQITDNQWANSIPKIASAYLKAFNNGVKVFPYFQNEQ